jgi:organic hydroperoxide reductase OsmC/OhrA
VQLRSPKEMGGEGDGTYPEHLFAVGYAACFEGALGVTGRREHGPKSPLSSLPTGMKLVDDVRPAVTADDRGARLALQRFEGAANLHQCLHSWAQETWRREPLFRVAVLRISA